MSKIEWTDYSFAPWFGCTKVAPECHFCYAEDWTVRRFHQAGWGPHAQRVQKKDEYWDEPPGLTHEKP